jgi:hypothetical protein
VPPASEDVVTLRGGALMVMLRPAVCLVWFGVCESVTAAVKAIAPTVGPDGVPVIAPVAAFKERPDGKLPAEILQV